MFGRLIDRLPNLRALLVITFRPEFAAPWVGRAHVATLSLSRFGRRHALAIVDGVSSGKALPAEVLDQIVAKTDGVPLFVEELTKTLLESGLLREEDGVFVLDHGDDPAGDPLDLAGLADGAPRSPGAGKGDRTDRGSDRARILVPPAGSGLADPGAGVAGCPRPTHGSRADPRARHAAGSDLCLQACAGAGHGLRSLLRTRRQRIHAEIARALEEKFADQVAAAPAAIARHYTEAGLADPAARYWLAAARTRALALGLCGNGSIC